MSKEKLVPKLRFEGFTKPWKLTKFNEIADVERGLTYHPSDIVEKGGVRVLRSSNIDEDRFITKDDDVFVNENAINIEFSQKQNILITSANGSPHLVGKHAILEQLETPSVHGGFMLLARTASPYFLNASMSSDWYRKFIRYHVAGGGGSIGNIKKSDLEHQLIYIPSKEEQEKIGSFFKKIDEMIQLQQLKVNKVKDIKSAYLSEMFPKEGEKYPKKRFEGFTDPWNEYDLGEVAQIKTGNTNVQDAIPDGKYTFFDRSTDIKRIDKFYYDEETIIYPGEGSEFYPRYFSGKYALHQRAYSVTSDIINLEYLTNMMMLRNNHFVNNAVGSTVKSLRMENFMKCKVFVPSLEEQEKIGQFFKNLDNQISTEEEKLAKLEKLKQAYLNNMFV